VTQQQRRVDTAQQRSRYLIWQVPAPNADDRFSASTWLFVPGDRYLPGIGGLDVLE
jgi:hypothetical protein